MKKILSKISDLTFVKKLKSVWQNKKVRKTFSVLNKIKNVLCWTIFVILIFLVVVMLTTRINGNTPTFFGYSVSRVSTGSMEPEIMVGDLILNKSVDDANALKVGDVVTYRGSGDTEGKFVTHKIITAPHINEAGVLVLQTKGVANDIADDEISADRVVAVMQSKIPVLDKIYNMFLSPWGLIIFILLLLFIFIDEFINLIRALSGHMPEEKRENIGEIIERLQLEEQQKQLKEKADKDKEKHGSNKSRKSKKKKKSNKG